MNVILAGNEKLLFSHTTGQEWSEFPYGQAVMVFRGPQAKGGRVGTLKSQ